MSVKVGIDFGTSNSGVAVSDGKTVKLLPIDQKNVVPEVVKTILYVTRDDKYFIGQEAIETYYRQNVNRLRRYVRKWVGEIEVYGGDMYFVRDVYGYVDELLPGRLLQFIKTALRTDGFEGTQIFERYYSVGDIITVYLRGLKQRAETLLDEDIYSVTLGRPVKFSLSAEKDRKAEETLRQAAVEAGFRQVEFEYEPVAAALYYEMTLKKPENVLIFDFGGGTLDITIMRLGDGKKRKVFANGGIDIAGSDFDQAIIRKRMLSYFGQGMVDQRRDINELIEAVSDWMVLPELSVPKARIKLEQAINAGEAPVQLTALKSLIFNDLAFSFYNAVERAKIDLSSQGATIVGLSEQEIDIWRLYTRYQFEKDIREYQSQIEEVLLQTVAASGLEVEQIDAVVKTGGSSNIPVFSEMLSQVFGPERVKTSNSFSSVTAGLAIKSALGAAAEGLR
jgi:hypothetical chaperone protein